MPTDRDITTFDYGVPAELFMGKRKGGPRQPLRYRRFATAAEAIRFAVEELAAVRALGARGEGVFQRRYVVESLDGCETSGFVPVGSCEHAICGYAWMMRVA